MHTFLPALIIHAVSISVYLNAFPSTACTWLFKEMCRIGKNDCTLQD